MNQFYSIIRKEITLAARSGYELFFPILYLFIIIIFFNISISYAGKNIILELIPLMIWIACLLICVLNIESIFKDDYDDGSLEIFVIHNENLEIDILAKIFSHWLLSNFPVVLIAPFLSLLLGLDYDTSIVLFLTLLIGTPTMSLLGSIAAALTISLKKNKILTSIVVLPLYIPILIFGTSAVNNSFFNMNYFSELILMGIIFFIFLLVTPIACSKALRISLD
jgi:heme exporter protein B